MMVGALAASAGPASAAELAKRLSQLASPVRVLYVAAHPDDENTQLLAWLARGRRFDAAYLSLTRGDGGQNLIGSEQRPLLGVIRTHELLAARALDGSRQFFTRLRDFGYSKSAPETLRRWGEERALGEVVRVLRQYRPHVIITRFPEEGDTHGHHLASAQLARRAMDAAADGDRFAELGSPWAVQRLFYNFPHFWANRGMEPPPGPRFDVDVGGYEAGSGLSYGEISGFARSMHKSQGFGASARFGPWTETLVLLQGSAPGEGKDPFAGLGEGASPVGKELLEAADALSVDRPSAAVPAIAKALQSARALPKGELRDGWVSKIEAVLVDAAGLLLDVRSERAELEPGAGAEVEVRALLRSELAGTRLHSVRLPGAKLQVGQALAHHRPWTAKAELRVPVDAPISTPHWLAGPPEAFVYADTGSLTTAPIGPDPLEAVFELEVAGETVEVRRGVRMHWVDPVQGERSVPVQVAPPVSVTPETAVALAPNGRGLAAVQIRAGERPWKGRVSVAGPVSATPPFVEVDLAAKASTRVEFRLEADEAAEVRFRTRSGGEPSDAHTRTTIDHPHIPVVSIRSPAVMKVQPVALKSVEGRIGYVPGSGDVAPEVLGRVGLEVRIIDDATLLAGDLSGFDAILLGVRAFNVNASLVQARDRLMAWVREGGTLVVQYNTKNWSAPLDVEIGPYPISIARGRVTDERAAMKRLEPKHPVLSAPNPITDADFDGWVQERGLYFASEWDEHYTPLFEVADPDEAAQRGSTLYTRYGRGHYLFTGLSLFRQLPAGNPGALRLLVNMLSLRPEVGS